MQLLEVVELDHAGGGMDRVHGADPAQAVGAVGMAGGFQPVGQAGIAVAEHQAHAAARIQLCRMLVQADAVVAVVQRLHPVVVDLQIPEVAVGHLIHFDQQRLVVGQVPVAVVVEDVRIAAHRLAQRLVGRRQLVRMRLVALGPVGEQPRGVLDEAGDPAQALLQTLSIQRVRLLLAVQRLDAQLGGLLGAAVEEGLAHDKRVARRFQPQPVAAGRRLLAQDQLEAAVGLQLQLAGVDEAGLDHRAVALVAALLGAEAQVGHAAAPAADPVLPLAVEARVLVQVVRVVGADLGRLVGRREEAGEVRVGELQVHFQGNAQQAGEVAVALGAVVRVAGRLGPQYLLAGPLELVAEIAPDLSAAHLPFDLVYRHVGLLWSGAGRAAVVTLGRPPAAILRLGGLKSAQPQALLSRAGKVRLTRRRSASGSFPTVEKSRPATRGAGPSHGDKRC
ncbi:hypothetical protein OF001_U30147 [Pseudomonas sp. OF001]|nr:hypothetical protein OF001_U30147 [Pseudomonas sp. OF001]